MKIGRTLPFPVTLAGVTLLGLVSAVLAAPTVTAIPFAPSGDGSEGSISAPIPLSSTSFLCGAEGADGAFTTVDDVMLLVNNVGTTPSVTALPTPYLTGYSGRPVRLSATRALVLSAGVDGVYRTADDAILLLDQLGSANSVTSIVIGGLDNSDSYAPVALSANRAVVASRGADLLPNTVDDVLVLLQNLGGTPTVTPISAPALDSGQSRVTPLSPTSFLAASNGADRALLTADDQVYLFTGVGSTNTRTNLNVPFIFQRAPRQSVRLSATRAVITCAGPDALQSTADDRLVLLDGLGTTNTVTPIPVPSIHDYGNGVAVQLSDTTLVVGTEGPDSSQNTLDDQVAVVTGLGTTNTVALLTVPGLDEDQECRPVRLSPTRIVVATGGRTTPTMNNADDEAVVIDGVGTTNTILRIPVPGIGYQAASVPLPLSSTAFMISHGGLNGVMDTGADDQVALITLANNSYTIEESPVGGELDPGAASATPQALGRGRAVYVGSGPDLTVGTGNDDQMRVISGLPQVRGIEVKKLSVSYNPRQASAPEAFSTSGVFGTDDPSAFFAGDLTVSVGNVAQTIPAALLKRSRSGVYSYADTKHLNGVITKLTLDPGKHKYTVTGKGTGTGLRTFTAASVPVSIKGDRIYLADAVRVKSSTKGYRYP